MQLQLRLLLLRLQRLQACPQRQQWWSREVHPWQRLWQRGWG